MKKIFSVLVLTCLFLIPKNSFSHPSPNSLVLFEIGEEKIKVQLLLPVSELSLATKISFSGNSEDTVLKYRDELDAYILERFKVKTKSGEIWNTKITNIEPKEIQEVEGKYYQDLVVDLETYPTDHKDLRNFVLEYKIIINEVSSHSAIVKIKNDWKNGIISENENILGIIGLNIRDNVIKPVKINIDQGNNFNGFVAFLKLGMKHISEGIDHLLFLLVLLLSTIQFNDTKKWTGVRSNKETLIKVIKIVTAFTIGHSITLILSTLNHFSFPQIIIETLIGVSILISAVHSIKPIFPNREFYIAGAFGLIHGLAFAYTLKELSLNGSNLIISLLGFNLGVEIFQILVVLAFLPFLFLIKKNLKVLNYFRIVASVFAIFAAFYWIFANFNN